MLFMQTGQCQQLSNCFLVAHVRTQLHCQWNHPNKNLATCCSDDAIIYVVDSSRFPHFDAFLSRPFFGTFHYFACAFFVAFFVQHA
jgi:hypothetical protein